MRDLRTLLTKLGGTQIKLHDDDYAVIMKNSENKEKCWFFTTGSKAQLWAHELGHSLQGYVVFTTSFDVLTKSIIIKTRTI